MRCSTHNLNNHLYFQDCLLCILWSQLEKKETQWTQIKEPRFLCPRNWDKDLTLITVDGSCPSSQFILPFLGWSIVGTLGPLVSWDQNFHRTVDFLGFFSPPTEFWWGKYMDFLGHMCTSSKGLEGQHIGRCSKVTPFQFTKQKILSEGKKT